MTDPSHDPASELFRAARDLAREQAAPPTGMPPLTELQQRFPEFELLGLIGRGGMGAVYKVRDPRLDRIVALKLLPPHLRADPSFAERFAREARTLARLQHPHILTVFDYGEREGLPYLVTEFVDGLDLRRLMIHEKLEASEALRIVPQICDALQFAHDHGVVHRDVKPENVLIDTRGHVKVADFGLAKILAGEMADLRLTATQETLGTPHYTAPEALRGDPVDHRADIFALGVLLYEMLTGHVPMGHFRLPSERAGTDRRLDEVVSRALRDEPEDRYQQVREVRRALERRETDAPPPVGPGPAGSGQDAARSTSGASRPNGERETAETQPAQPKPHPAMPKAQPARPAHGAGALWTRLVTLVLVLILGFVAFSIVLSLFHGAVPPPGPVGSAPEGASTALPYPAAGRAVSISAMLFALAALLLVFVTRAGIRRMHEVRESGEPHGAFGAVCHAWLPTLVATNAVAIPLLPTLRDPDSTQILQVAVVAALILVDFAILIAHTRMLRADAMRRPSGG